jgi:hypothetical protein
MARPKITIDQQFITVATAVRATGAKSFTAKDLNLPVAKLNKLADAEVGLLRLVETRKHTSETGEPSRGRPTFVFALTPKATKRVRRIEAKEAIAA